VEFDLGMEKKRRKAERRYSPVAMLRVVVAGVGEWISERQPSRVMRW
jgi:hypothetical protein